jgi:hypothetical protein
MRRLRKISTAEQKAKRVLKLTEIEGSKVNRVFGLFFRWRYDRTLKRLRAALDAHAGKNATSHK